jgi:hypothetical protein
MLSLSKHEGCWVLTPFVPPSGVTPLLGIAAYLPKKYLQTRIDACRGENIHRDEEVLNIRSVIIVTESQI